MKYAFTWCFILCLIAHLALAQNEIDSLEREIKKDIQDSVKVKLLIRLSVAYQYSDYTASKKYAEEALKIAEEQNLENAIIRAYQNMGVVYTASGDYNTALKYDNLSLQSSLASDSSLLSQAYNNIGNDYFDLGEYDEAYFYFTKSYSTARDLNEPLQMAVSLHNVGRVFKELGQYERALEHLNLSKKMSKRIGDKVGIAYSFDEIGDVMLREHEYDSALTTLRNSLRITRLYKENVLEPRVLTKIATIYLIKNDYAGALALYDSTYRLHEKTNNKFGIAEVDLGRGLVYLKQGKYDEAQKLIESGLVISQELNARVLEIKCFNELSSLWEMKGDFKKSLEYFKQYKQLEDTLFSQETQEKLLHDQIRFETESKDSQIAALSLSQTIQKNELKKKDFLRNILVVVMALSVILLITVYRSGQRRRQINTLLLQHQDEMEKRSEELERLNQVKDKFFSIISHDLRSPINALAGMLDLLDRGAVSAEDLPKHIHELTGRFNHTRTLLNNLLDWTLLQMDKLNLQAAKIDLHKMVEENIQLLGSIQEKKIKLLNEVPKNAIAFADSNTVNLVIRNLMTNAIKFTNDGGMVKITAKDNGLELLISVSDNGIGINPEVLHILFDKTAPYTTRGTANEKGTGLGLILCKEFVEKNGGKIKAESEEGKGSTFSFTLPKA